MRTSGTFGALAGDGEAGTIQCLTVIARQTAARSGFRRKGPDREAPPSGAPTSVHGFLRHPFPRSAVVFWPSCPRALSVFSSPRLSLLSGPAFVALADEWK